jgi:hypothetical protein
MLKSLTWKETRELLPLVLVALLGQAAMPLFSLIDVNSQILPNDRTIPFINDSTVGRIGLIGLLAALVFGLWQSGGELFRGTLLFLLHRPLTRTQIFGVKLLVGIALTVVIAGVPLTLYTLWAAMPGSHASPFYWSMAVPYWLNAARLPIAYLGAFLSGLRPGRWLGSRLLPAAAGLCCCLLLSLTNSVPWLSLALTLGAVALLLVAILHVAESRDFS